MATPNQKLTDSLARLADLQAAGRTIFRSNELTRVHRQRLLEGGFIKSVMKGWLVSWSAGADDGDTTPWYAAFWEFCARYCANRFGDRWHLSPEQSLLLHAEDTIIPDQVVIYTPDGTNNTVELLFGTSLFDLEQKQMPNASDVTSRAGLRVFTPEAALIKVPPVFFQRRPLEAQVVLASLPDASGVLARLLDGGHSSVAGRLAGAARRTGRIEMADDILHAMKAAGYDVRENDPFEAHRVFGDSSASDSPIASRLRAMWQSAREAVLDVFPTPPGLPEAPDAYLHFVDGIYASDAYHSLSIEGYRVTPELIERVRAGDWDPESHAADADSRNALAARGYWQAFQLVKKTVADIITGESPGELVRAAHPDWYRELFRPSVAAGLVPPSALAGYRNDAVFLRGSRHVPPRPETVRDAMPALFDLMEQEPEASVRAVLGHWLFGYIHPFPDGNGRVGRFLMNAMLASGGYPWTVIRVEDRDEYLAALESASVGLDIGPLAGFIAGRSECAT